LCPKGIFRYVRNALPVTMGWLKLNAVKHTKRHTLAIFSYLHLSVFIL
jgi:hypothetical protein